MFKLASNNIQDNRDMESSLIRFRPNRVCDVAKVWLQILQPWRDSSDFLNSVLDLDVSSKDKAMFDENGN